MFKITNIGVNPNSSGLGDTLWLTSICKHYNYLTVELPTKRKDFVPLFDGLCKEVILTDSPCHTVGYGEGTYAKRMLRLFEYYGDDDIPFVFVKKEDLEKAEQILNPILKKNKGKTPIAIVANCAKHWYFVKEMKKAYFEKFIEQLTQSNYLPIQFGFSDNYTPLDGCVPILDSSISEKMGLFKLIGKYMGVDTGDYHLMMAVGGSCSIFYPKGHHTSVYDPSTMMYNSSRVIYIPFEIENLRDKE